MENITDDLSSLKDPVDDLIVLQDKIHSILKEIASIGYSCQAHFHSRLSGYKTLSLPLYISLSSQEGQIKVKGLINHQKDWVSKLGFCYKPSGGDLNDIIIDPQNPHKGILYVTIYYSTPSSFNRNFLSLDKEGNLVKCKIKNGFVYYRGTPFFAVRDWSNYDLIYLNTLK
jgi:hypothetical protein